MGLKGDHQIRRGKYPFLLLSVFFHWKCSGPVKKNSDPDLKALKEKWEHKSRLKLISFYFRWKVICLFITFLFRNANQCIIQYVCRLSLRIRYLDPSEDLFENATYPHFWFFFRAADQNKRDYCHRSPFFISFLSFFSFIT